MREERVEPDLGPPNTSLHNGVSERFNKSLQMKIRSVMIDSGIPKTMWIFAVEATVHIYNRSPHKSIDFETPLKKFCGKENLHFDTIRRFGGIAYVLIPKPNRKLENRSIRAIFVGYSSTGFVLWHSESGKLMSSKHVRFNGKIVYEKCI